MSESLSSDRLLEGVGATAAEIAQCKWLEPGGVTEAIKIADFLGKIGLETEVASIRGPMFVPGLAIVDGRIVIDPDIPSHPGDLLHEAGHIAVVETEKRRILSDVGTDPGEEMAAIAWSVAAAKACAIPLEVLFMTAGYRGGAESMIAAFADDAAPFGVPLLAWWGMTANPGEAGAFPKMARWLR